MYGFSVTSKNREDTGTVISSPEYSRDHTDFVVLVVWEDHTVTTEIANTLSCIPQSAPQEESFSIEEFFEQTPSLTLVAEEPEDS